MCVCVLGRAAAGRGAGVGAVLLPAGDGDVSCVHRAAGPLCPGGRVSQHGRRQTPQTAAVRPRLLLHAGVHHPRLLHRRHAGPHQGERGPGAGPTPNTPQSPEPGAVVVWLYIIYIYSLCTVFVCCCVITEVIT